MLICPESGKRCGRTAYESHPPSAATGACAPAGCGADANAVPTLTEDRPLTSTGELERENEALRERISTLNAAILRINASLDMGTVLQEVVDSARALSPAPATA